MPETGFPAPAFGFCQTSASPHRAEHAAPSSQEFIRFLNPIEREVPAGKTVHAILDNYAAHKHPVVGHWRSRHPGWTFHFTPTSTSWLNAVEGFFAILTKHRE